MALSIPHLTALTDSPISMKGKGGSLFPFSFYSFLYLIRVLGTRVEMRKSRVCKQPAIRQMPTVQRIAKPIKASSGRIADSSPSYSGKIITADWTPKALAISSGHNSPCCSLWLSSPIIPKASIESAVRLLSVHLSGRNAVRRVKGTDPMSKTDRENFLRHPCSDKDRLLQK